MSDNQRKAYRVSAGGTETIRVIVTDESGRSAEGRGLDVNAIGIGVLFPGRVPDWAANTELRLTIEHWKLPEPAEIDGILVSRLERGAGVRCGFRFTNPAQLDLWADVFNRRRSFRVEPAFDEPVDVALRAEKGWASGTEEQDSPTAPRGRDEVRARLLDICPDGLGVLLDRELRHLFSKGMQLDVRLSLTEGPALLRAQVAHVSDRGGRLAVGLSFDEKATDDFDSEQAKVTRYVMERQRAVLQRTRKPAE